MNIRNEVWVRVGIAAFIIAVAAAPRGYRYATASEDSGSVFVYNDGHALKIVSEFPTCTPSDCCPNQAQATSFAADAARADYIAYGNPAYYAPGTGVARAIQQGACPPKNG